MSLSTFTWEKGDLITPEGTLIARVRSDVLEYGQQRLLIETSPGTLMSFRMRATDRDGQVFTLQKEKITVFELIAQCADRAYTLSRTSHWHRRRVIKVGTTPVATIRALVGGGLELGLLAAAEQVPMLDLVFMSYGCFLIDGVTGYVHR
ncbi:hypothetical protein EML15_02655 [Corynebacterium sp. sy017]|uniref:hypothetical protein n=1 Tax=unclassified Corynebacterium TaxID=2624378 RepID=UPI0011847C5B|nr:MULTISPECIES: hypothetical protein [unclassified Corynebacterium]MBP3088055.1 hypothetical protein [Corynebacterium sp. sy017]QDZ43009.1 hypothetical protein FQV43_07415 [Corynebacterium sp. sy039]TSD92583.1 hypothetical protein ELY17_02655 [Corynebacterium sp. SY003]